MAALVEGINLTEMEAEDGESIDGMIHIPVWEDEPVDISAIRHALRVFADHVTVAKKLGAA